MSNHLLAFVYSAVPNPLHLLYCSLKDAMFPHQTNCILGDPPSKFASYFPVELERRDYCRYAVRAIKPSIIETQTSHTSIFPVHRHAKPSHQMWQPIGRLARFDVTLS